MCMLFFTTSKYLFVAFCCVLMSFALLLVTGKNVLCLVAFLCVLVSFILFQSADQIAFLIIALFCMSMSTFTLFQSADQRLFLGITFIRMGVCSFAFFFPADQTVLITFIRMSMFFYSTVRSSLCSKCRKDQCIYSTENYYTCQNTDRFLPAFMLPVLQLELRRLMQQRIFHLTSLLFPFPVPLTSQDLLNSKAKA